MDKKKKQKLREKRRRNIWRFQENCVPLQKINAMSNMNSSYRPHDPGHDYYAPGIYLITLVVRNRERNHALLGRLNGDVKAPAVVLTEIGKAVEEGRCAFMPPCVCPTTSTG